MAPVSGLGGSGTCAICSQGFTSRKSKLTCCGPCGKRFHCKCLNITAVDYDLFWVNETCTYKCKSCIKRGNAAETTPVNDSITAPTASDNSDEPYDTESVIADLVRKVDALTQEVSTLKDEKGQLISLVQSLDKTASFLRIDLAKMKAEFHQRFNTLQALTVRLPSEGASYASALLKKPANPAPQTASHPTGTQCASVNSMKATLTSVLPSAPITPAVSASSVPLLESTASVFEDGVGSVPVTDGINSSCVANYDTETGFTVVSRRAKRRSPAQLGTAQTSSLKLATKPAIEKALFVTRLHPDTSGKDISSVVSSVLSNKNFRCVKLKTRHDSYASFCIVTDSAGFTAINCAEVWPEGCLYRVFLGKIPNTDDLSAVMSSETVNAQH